MFNNSCKAPAIWQDVVAKNTMQFINYAMMACIKIVVIYSVCIKVVITYEGVSWPGCFFNHGMPPWFMQYI